MISSSYQNQNEHVSKHFKSVQDNEAATTTQLMTLKRISRSVSESDKKVTLKKRKCVQKEVQYFEGD